MRECVFMIFDVVKTTDSFPCQASGSNERIVLGPLKFREELLLALVYPSCHIPVQREDGSRGSRALPQSWDRVVR